LLRVLAALGGAFLAARLLPTPSGVLTLVASLGVAGVYVSILLLLKELNGNDWSYVRRVMSRKTP
jgi:hypothetical protein